MYDRIVEVFKNETSKERAYNHVLEITQHHRIQASPGHREAANYAAAEFKKAGLETEILSYAGDGKTKYWQYPMPQEWVCTKGILKMESPEEKKLADFEEVPISLIQRSAATPKNGISGELVILDKGDEESEYEDIDFEGKFVMTDGDYDRVRSWAIENRGAVGIITDRMSEFLPVRHRFDVGDALTYTSFWWYGSEKKCFGFVLSPKAGDALRKKAKEETITLHAEVGAKFYDGHIEVVSGLIRGKTDEEVLIVAHLCHPQPSANDNASGSATALESARVINKLINEGKLNKPKRSIRFLVLPEMSGTFAYLANNEKRIEKTVAGLNLDMVGENQELCGSSLVIEQLPHASGHFAGVVAKRALLAVAEEVPNLANTSSYPLFRYTFGQFSGGSDHYILSDPTVGIGSPMLIQWPDKFYHTSMDTVDKVDPKMLERVANITSSYAYFIANADKAEAIWLIREMVSDFKKSVRDYISQRVAKGVNAIEHKDWKSVFKIRDNTPNYLRYYLDVETKNINSISRLNKDISDYINLTIEQMQQYIVDELNSFNKDFELLLSHSSFTIDSSTKASKINTDSIVRKCRNIIPKRLSRGPLSLRGQIDKLPDEMQEQYYTYDKDKKSQMRKLTYLVYWMDGKRNLDEIVEKTTFESGDTSHEVALFLIEVLQHLKLIDVEQIK
ncbi:MAG: DUF4910 domain-containing protein [Clostridia bacterium]